MSEFSPYGVTQHADAAMVTADQLVGERAGGVTAESAFGSAAMFSTAPYKPPRTREPVEPVFVGPRLREREGKCLGKQDTCQAGPIKGTDLCLFHTPKNGSGVLIRAAREGE